MLTVLEGVIVVLTRRGGYLQILILVQGPLASEQSTYFLPHVKLLNSSNLKKQQTYVWNRTRLFKVASNENLTGNIRQLYATHGIVRTLSIWF